MPWHLPKDFKWFKEKTLGNIIAMGRTTYNSIGRALPKRLNIVLSRNPELRLQDAFIGNFETVLSYFKESNIEVFVIGGSEIYRQFLPYADRLYITHIEHEFEGDTYFPEYDLNDYNVAYERHETCDKYPLRFNIYEKIKRKNVIDS